MRLPGNLHTFLQLVNHVENRIVVRNFHNRAIGKYVADALHEFRVFRICVKIVRHEETTAQQILAHLFALGFRERPFAYLHRVQKRQVIFFVFVKIDRLFDRSRLDAAQPSHRFEKMPIRARIILRPE